MTDDLLDEADSILSNLPRFTDRGAAAYKPGLDRMRALLAELHNPHERYPCLHVAGTNGKGSTASFLASIASASGLRVGLHTSPHLFHVAERMRIDGVPADVRWLARAVVDARRAIDAIEPSYFELTVALSLLYFAEQDADLAVVEVGLGGRLDATNVLEPIVCVITEVGLDHSDLLGETVEAIAAEKAGIVKRDTPVVTSARPPAAEVIRRAAMDRGAPFHSIDDETELVQQTLDVGSSSVTVRTPVQTYPALSIGLGGGHQIRNACAALRAIEILEPPLPQRLDAVIEGLRDVRRLSGLRGRLEVIQDEPLILADVAHNAVGLGAVLRHLRTIGRLPAQLTVLFGVMRDKDVDAMGRLLAAESATVRPVPVDSDRALRPTELAAILDVVGVSVAEPCSVPDGIQAFLSDASRSDILLIAGSHLVVAQLETAPK